MLLCSHFDLSQQNRPGMLFFISTCTQCPGQALGTRTRNLVPRVRITLIQRNGPFRWIRLTRALGMRLGQAVLTGKSLTRAMTIFKIHIFISVHFLILDQLQQHKTLVKSITSMNSTCICIDFETGSLAVFKI